MDSLYTRHLETPAYERKQTQLDATHYNHVCMALKRMSEQVRLSIPGLKTLDLILQADAWIIVDTALNDVPVAAWTEFDTVGRKELHKPIKCLLVLYHAHADKILERTLEAMELILGEQLGEYHPDSPFAVLPMPDGHK